MSYRRPPSSDIGDAIQDWLNRQAAAARERSTGSGGGNDQGPPEGARRTGPPRRVPRWPFVIFAVLIILWLVVGAVIDPAADYLWFTNVGFGDVWTTQFAYGIGLFFLGLVVGLVFLLGNLLLAWRWGHEPTDQEFAAQAHTRTWRVSDAEVDVLSLAAALPRRSIRTIVAGVAIFFALLFAFRMPAAWQTVALWLHAVPYAPTGAATPDPIFGLDLGWWLFSLPMLHLVADVAVLLFVLSLLLTGTAYGLVALRGGDVAARRPVLHLAILGGALLLAFAGLQWLGRYDLAYGQNGAVPGVTATDAAIRLPLIALTSVTTAVLAVAIVVLAVLRRSRATRLVAAIGGSWYVLLVVAGAVVPAVYQQLVVTPNQNSAEAPYIANNIALTRQGFGLDTWSVQSYTGKASLTAADVSNDQATFDNARLWDYRPLGTTLDQLQTVRQYYDFTSVDIDRYVIGGVPTEVMLSAREMALDKSQSSPTWIAQHILYTHGYGLAMVPVNAVDSNGLPDLIIKDLPTTSSPGAPVVSQPRIYFGERPSDWVLVDAQTDEFDYPSSTGNGNDVTDRYTGSAGLSVGSLPSRLLWAAKLGDLNLLISDQVTDQTRLLLHRSLADRLGTLAPFLTLDPDPYLVIGPDGRLVWIQDAYLTSDGLPAGTATDDTALKSQYDYIRNSVKITVDAYDGSTHFYVADPTDPLIRAWEGVFPTMFQPLSAMPSGLVAHLRTPEAMFNAQTKTFARYHVTDVASFYKNDNIWTVPSVSEGSTQVVAPEAYYVEMRLPDQAAPEYVLIQPMVPASRPNMIAWVAARNDGAARGQVIVYQLPANTTIQGPTQIEARIDQDPVISAQISLWNQSGSQVIRGNLLVIPVGTSFLYLEPIFLQSTSAAFPQLTKVVVASSTTIGWGATLQTALQAVTSGAGTGGVAGTGGGSGGPQPTATPAPTAANGNLPTDIPGLIAFANDHFAAAKAAQARGDFVTYGQELQLVQDALVALQGLTGVTPSPVPSISTGP